MLLARCEDIQELIPFLRRDYANNLYFFTYLDEVDSNSDIEFLTAKYKGKVELALLLSPIHCCISSSNIDYLDDIAGQLPPINSVHMVGRSDLVEYLLKIVKGPERDKHIYSYCEFTKATIPNKMTTQSQKASKSDLKSLIEFYNSNDMLLGSDFRLPKILSRGKAYFVQKDDKIISCALTTTETNDAAMIGAVYTTPHYRTNGYAKDCISNLVSELVSEYKKPYLFYDSSNVFLCELYHSLGFRQINTWLLATRKYHNTLPKA